MKNRLKKWLIIGGTCLAGILIAAAVILFVDNDTEVKVIVETDNPDTTLVFVNNEQAQPGAATGVYTAKVNDVATYDVRIENASSESFEQTITTGKTTISVPLKQKKPEAATAEAYNNPGAIFNSARYFGANDWTVASVSFDKNNEGSLAVSRINTQTNRWELVDEGTDLDINSLRALGAPRDLLIYLERL